MLTVVGRRQRYEELRLFQKIGHGGVQLDFTEGGLKRLNGRNGGAAEAHEMVGAHQQHRLELVFRQHTGGMRGRRPGIRVPGVGKDERPERPAVRHVRLRALGVLREPVDQIPELAGVRRVEAAGPDGLPNRLGTGRAAEHERQHQRQRNRVDRFWRHRRKTTLAQWRESTKRVTAQHPLWKRGPGGFCSTPQRGFTFSRLSHIS